MRETELPEKNLSATLPNGWKIGDTCVMIVNRKKGYTQEYVVDGYYGQYFKLRDKYGNMHHASVLRMFRTRDEALISLQQSLIGGEQK